MDLLHCSQNVSLKQALFVQKRMVFQTGAEKGKTEPEKSAEEKEKEEKDKAEKEAAEKAKTGGVPIDQPVEKKEAEKKKADIPPRPKDAPGGKEFVESLKGLSREDREKKIQEAVTSGNIPDFLRQLKPVEYEATDANGQKHKVKIFVMPDYLAVGSNEDFMRMPMSPQTAQKIAEKFGCVLPTKKIVDKIHFNGSTKRETMKVNADIVGYLGISPGDAYYTDKDGKVQQNGNLMMSNSFYKAHDELTQKQLDKAGYELGDIVSGIKKELIITEALLTHPGNLAFHGGLHPDGSFHQSGIDLAHEPTYADYSHGARMISRYIEIDGQPMDLAQVLAHPTLYKLVSDEKISNALAFYKSKGEQVPELPHMITEPSVTAPPVGTAEKAVPAIKTPTTTTEAPAGIGGGGAGMGGAIGGGGMGGGRAGGYETAPAPAAAPSSAPAYEKPQEQVETKASGKVFVLGDSLSMGFRPFLKGLNVTQAHTKTETDSTGATTGEMLQTLKTKILSQDVSGATLVIVGGTNDIFIPDSLPSIQSNLQSIYALAKEKGMKVVAATLPPLAHSAYSENNWNEVSKNPKYKDKYKTYENYNNDLIERWHSLNDWIRQQGVQNSNGQQTGPDEVVEFDHTFEDPDKPGKLKPELSGEGGLHLKNYAPMGEALRQAVLNVNPAETAPSKMETAVAKGQDKFETEPKEDAKAKTAPGESAGKIVMGKVDQVDISPSASPSRVQALQQNNDIRTNLPTGYSPPKNVPDSARALASSLLGSQKFGSLTYFETPDGRQFIAIKEWHPPYPADKLNKPHVWHHGISLIEKNG